MMAKSLLLLGIVSLMIMASFSGCNPHRYRMSLPQAVEDKLPKEPVPDCDREKPPRQVDFISPQYPVEAQQRGITGIVYVKVQIDTTGLVTNATIVQESGVEMGFEESAIEAAIKTKWEPAECDGRPISTYVIYKVDFSLK